MATSDAPSLLTPHQVAAELQISKTKTYELLARNLIPSVRVGSKIIRVRRSDLNAWLAQRITDNGTATGSTPAAAHNGGPLDGRRRRGS